MTSAAGLFCFMRREIWGAIDGGVEAGTRHCRITESRAQVVFFVRWFGTISIESGVATSRLRIS